MGIVRQDGWPSERARGPVGCRRRITPPPRRRKNGLVRRTRFGAVGVLALPEIS